MAEVQLELVGPSQNDSDSDEEDITDRDYRCPESKSYVYAFPAQWILHSLRPRVPISALNVLHIDPIPDILTPAHLLFLGFEEIGSDEPRPFLDVGARIAAFFIGPPTQRLHWEHTVIQATNDMTEAHIYFERQPGDDNTLHDGIRYNSCLGRPSNTRNTTENILTLAGLRLSSAVQDIVSFQNAMLEQIAPRLWMSANETINAIVAEDQRLKLPFRIANYGSPQPTAFPEVHYRFAINDLVPRREPPVSAGMSGWQVLTSLGDYDSRFEGRLVLWEHRKMVTFPPGSTFFCPTGMNYSFTTVSGKPSQMLISQTFHNDLHHFVANGFQPDSQHLSFANKTSQERESDLLQRAEALAGKYITVGGFDARCKYQ
ncbi:hypothetical protein C8R45DRAFT_1109694 [Mycena sanguinolenta]|nr:hypothetical protein C8R45DRAFT_1109694 [Mycena sanguinolenta]